MPPAVAASLQDSGLLAAIAQETDDAIFSKDAQGRYQFANRAALEAIRLPLGQVIGHTDADLLDADIARRIMQVDQRVLGRGETVEVEEGIPGADGTLSYWSSRKAPLRDAQGRIVGLIGIARNVTARKQAELRADADRLKLQMAIQAAGLVTAEIDYRTNQNHISGELARLMELGDGPMVVPRQAIFDRIHPDDRERYLEAIRRTTAPGSHGHLAIDVRALMPSGTLKWLHIVLQVTFTEIDGELKPDRGICAAADVTEKMVAERKMRTAQRMTEGVIENAGALVWAKDLEGRFILSNQAWRRLHGLTEEAARDITDDVVFGPRIAAQLRENDRRVIASGEPVVVHEKAEVHGRSVTYRSHKFPLFDEAGRVHAVCGVSTDITEVVEADRRKDEFIATLAHELRNPLAPIRNGLEILKRLPDVPAQAGKVRDMMDRQLAHLVRLVDDLLDVSRITRDKLEMRMKPVTLQEIVDHAVESSRPAIDASGHTLQVQLPGRPIRIEGDLTRLAQVVSNLLNNSAKYTPPGGRIDVNARFQGDHVCIEVTDNGAGIAADKLPHVFDLFSQVDRTMHQAQGGLGIGLWLVQKLVEMHRGSITAKSAGPGKGSTFTLKLPAALG
ncbi:PAS domain-containing sensor histidine kinase [Ramlibacter sp. PS4R-6]|uniref:PAS domain-containing sensor histidine kinase n=1 Tax=Ramlibacter sp. PS4R-6 TaxID=3133438 RepID=UPI0030A8BBCE